jgi:uncharacterized protein (TIGR02611 family)
MTDMPGSPSGSSSGASGSTGSGGGGSSSGGASSVFRSARALIGRNPTVNRVYRTSVGVVGGATVALGVVMLPLPGPGALIGIGGLAILGTEFEGAARVSRAAGRGAKRVAAYAKERRAKAR